MSASQESSPLSSSDAGTSKGAGAKGRPRGSHGDSLIKRSKEVLGLDRVVGMQRRKKGAKDDSEKPATRREQVLEAQRTHRLRTKIYIKELESEVLRLRKSEAAAKAKVEVFEQRTQVLVQSLIAHGIQPPLDGTAIPGDVDIPGGLDGQEIATAKPQLQTIPIRSQHTSPDAALQAWSPPPAYPASQQDSVQLLPDNGDLAVVPSFFLPATRLPNVAGLAEPTKAFSFDDSQAELDFILTLERSCMQHLHESHFHPDAPPFDAQQFFAPGSQPIGRTEDETEAVISGHVLTTSMPLWQNIKQEGSATAMTSPNARRAELANLLKTSHRLGLRGEIAPVQILEILKFRSKTAVITVQQLQRLAVELQVHLKCYGFGAVFDENVVRNLVMEL